MSSGAIPLISHAAPGAVIAYRNGEAVTAQRFLREAAHLARRLPAGNHVLNVCLDRYSFSVGFAACLMSRRVSLLPSTHTAEVIRRLAEFAPDVLCLTDRADCDIQLPQYRYPTVCAFEDALDWSIPDIPAEQIAAIVFTSGSTGTPLPYAKSWGPLVRCILGAARRLELDDGRSHTLIGTVPAQHMYGLESTVLLAWLSGNAFSAERPFYPADIAAAIQAVPRPRVLVSTPIHLRTVLASEVTVPAVDLLVSATAPLAQPLARDAELKFDARLLEIYGSTETGQIATRRTAQSLTWTLWPEVTLNQANDRTFAQGGHIEQMTTMCDVIEILSDTEFLLHGRTADLVNVAGKRSSFAYLNAQLLAIPGVIDGAFFMREAESANTGVPRLAAVAVAPGLSMATVTEHLRQRIDAVFLPRPLILVSTLPRNATGKLPQHELRDLADRHLKVTST